MKGLNASQQPQDWRQAILEQPEDAAPATSPASSDAGTPALGPRIRGLSVDAAPSDVPAANADWGPLGVVGDVMRNFNDKATFGLYPKLIDALSGNTGQQDAIQYSEQHDPIASITGSTLGYMVPGAGIDSAITKTAPGLLKNTVGALMRRGAASSTATRVADDTIRGNNPDPAGVAIDAASGAALGPLFHGIEWLSSPKARTRSMGTSLSGADKGTIRDFIDQAASQGVDLNIPEAAQATIPAKTQDIRAAYDTAIQSPAGSIAAATFDAQRSPSLKDAGRRIVSLLGGGVDPVDATETAKAALAAERKAGDIRTEAAYAPVMRGRAVPPTWVPKTPGVGEAVKDVLNNDVTTHGISQDIGRPVKSNDMSFLDAVTKRMGGMIDNNIKEDPAYASYMKREKQALQDRMDQVNPAYQTARQVAEDQMGREMALEAGPLGTIAKSNKTSTQGDALFGVKTKADRLNAGEAIVRMDSEKPGVPKGILANRIDEAVSNDPLSFGNKALPNEYSEDLARLAAGSDYGNVDATMRASRAVQPAAAPFAAPGAEGPYSAVFARIRNYGRGPTVKLLQDPASLRMMGVESPLHYGLTLTGNAAVQSATERKVRKRKSS